MKTMLPALVLVSLFAVALLAQQSPVPAEQNQSPPGRGQGRGPAPGGGRRGAAPQRDVAAPTGTAVIAGRVVASDTGRPLRRARVVVGGGGRPRATSTDEQGRYRVTGLAAGNYTITATKSGFVDGAFGQRRALGTGAPVELIDGQHAANIDIKLARGGVVTGRVLDEEGEPLARAVVTVLRQQYVRGQKQLTTAGADQSDDRGQYRVFGLPPGDYFVSASAGSLDQVVRQAIGDLGVQQPEASGYAPTFYPGVTSASDASRLKLAAAQEITGVDFQIQIVPFATVRGVVAGGSATVTLIPDQGGTTAPSFGALGGALGALAGGGMGRGGPGMIAGSLRAMTRADGSFTIPNVTPGKYTIVARAGGGADGGLRTAIQQLIVAGEEVNIALTPAAGVHLAGTITFEAAGAPPPNGFTGFRVIPVPLGSLVGVTFGGRGGRSDDTPRGQFSINDVAPGDYVLRASAPHGWTMKSIYLDGRDVTDVPIEVNSEDVTGLNVIFTDKISSLKGTVRDTRSNPVGNVTVIVFPSDARLWLPQSRHIITARTDAIGTYQLSMIPSGEYFVIAVEDVEQGEWFDPSYLDQIRNRAMKIKIDDGDQRTQDLKVASM